MLFACAPPPLFEGKAVEDEGVFEVAYTGRNRTYW